MDQLKKILKWAFSRNAFKIILKEGELAKLYFSGGEESFDAEGIVSLQVIDQLLGAFFPKDKDKLSTGEMVQGQLTIVEKGKLTLIGQPKSPKSIAFYVPPEGDALATKDWTLWTEPPPPLELPPLHAVLSPPIHAAEASPAPIVIPMPPKLGLAYEIPLSPPGIMPLESSFEPKEQESLAYKPGLPLVEDNSQAYIQESHLGLKNPASLSYAPLLAETSPPKPPPMSASENAAAEIHFGAHIPGTVPKVTGGAPIDTLLNEMIRLKASDMHLTQGEKICFRIDGEIVRHGDQVLGEHMMRDYILPILPTMNHEEFARTHDTDFSYAVEGLARFRVNIFRDRNGVGAVLRQIPAKVLSADQLNLPQVVRALCNHRKGLIVVTGPTGSGKSTTLAAMVDLINSTRGDHILTVEDPIEFIHEQKKCLINQREIKKHTASFSRALKAALREDPDIVLIGEMRDLETVEIAIETAETGHLVFGTLHTNTAISTIDRIIDQFPEETQAQVRVMLAESLKGVVAQTLCKKKGGGRVAALEVLVVNHAVSSLIREGKTYMITNVMQTQRSEGNMSLNESLVNLVTKGVVDAKEAWIKAVDKDGLVKTLQSKGVPVDFVSELKVGA